MGRARVSPPPRTSPAAVYNREGDGRLTLRNLGIGHGFLRVVIPAKAGIPAYQRVLDPSFRWGDEAANLFRGSLTRMRPDTRSDLLTLGLVLLVTTGLVLAGVYFVEELWPVLPQGVALAISVLLAVAVIGYPIYALAQWSNRYLARLGEAGRQAGAKALSVINLNKLGQWCSSIRRERYPGLSSPCRVLRR